MDVIQMGVDRTYVYEETPEAPKRPARIDPVRCMECNRHTALYMVTSEYGITYEDPVLLDNSFICKRCWKRLQKEKKAAQEAGV